MLQQLHVLTLLQVKNSAGQWVDAAPLPGTFVCNIGDMFEVKLTTRSWEGVAASSAPLSQGS
jgi:isopenicillin N synthase-like dioxygenase